MMQMDGGMAGWGYGGAIWAILGVVLVVLAILGIIWLARHATTGTNVGPFTRERAAIRELELRYARGELDREAYQAIRRDLEADGG
jgi:putative membrane protein